MIATPSPIQVPAFRKSLRVEHISGEGACFLSEVGQLALTGSAVEAISKQIDGKTPADEIATSLQHRVKAEDVYYTLNMMEQNGLIYDAAGHGDLPELVLWNYLGADLGHVRERLGNVSVKVVTTPELDNREFAWALRDFGLEISESGDFTVVFTSDYLHPTLAQLNSEALQTRRPWMLAKPSGVIQFIGPIFWPGRTACWACLAHRLRNRRALEQFLNVSGRSSLLASVCLPSPLDALSVRLAALHAAKWIALSGNPQVEGTLVSLDVNSLALTAHPVAVRPQCPACGYYDRELRPPLLDNRANTTSLEGGHRSYTAEEAFSKWRHHVSPITGIVRELTPMQAASDDIVKLCVASHNFAIDATSLETLRLTGSLQSCGKGSTETQAKTGALLEALERYSGVFSGDEPRIRSSYQALGSNAIHPNSCMLFSDRQYAMRDEWNKLGSAFSLVPQRFQETAEIEWSPVWSLTHRTFKYLPTAYLYYGYPQTPDTATCWADSNGNAAGGSIEEAILQGFFELVERDAVAMWWYNRLSAPAVDLESFDDPTFSRTLDHYRRNGRQMWVLDVTSDFSIPAFAAVSRRIDQPLEEITLGFGAHVDAHVALLRAVSEMNQFLPAVSGPAGSDGKRQYAYSDASAIRWWQTASVAREPYLLPDSSVPARRKSDYITPDTDDQLVDLMNCVLKAEELGLETLMLDQTRPDVGVPVVKVIMPGIRHFWARLAPGRLYDVPVSQGKLARPLPEEKLNPIPIFV